MLSFIAELDGTGSFLSQTWSAGIGSCPGCGFTYPALLRGAERKVILEKRSLLDYIRTSKEQIFGDHACSNLQVTADISIPLQISGPFEPYDPLYGLDASLVREPSIYYGYDINEVISHFSASLKTGRVWVYRDHPLGGSLRLKAVPGHPFSYGRSCVRSFTVILSSVASRRYSLQGEIAVSYRLPSIDRQRSFYVQHTVGYEQRYSSAGALTYDGRTAFTTVMCYGATAPNATTGRSYYLSSTGAWSTSSTTRYTSPSIFSSISEVSMREIFANPSCLFGATNVSPLAITGLNPVQNVSTKDTLVAIYDDSPDAIFRYEESLARFIFQHVYLRKSSPIISDWTEIGDTAADNINQVSINSLAYVRDLGSCLGSLRSTISLAMNPKNPKAWTSWWLSMRYGDRLTYHDTIEVSKAVGHSLAMLAKGRNKDFYVSRACDIVTERSDVDRSTLEIQRFIKLYYKPKYDDWVSRVIRKALEWDLWPTLDNSWDLIPFSFVVDWFVDVQSALESIDRKNLMLLHRVLSVIQTEKRIYTVDDTLVDDIYVADMVVTAYDRNLLRSLPTSPFRVDRGHLASINIIDGVSLLFQAF